MSKKWRRKKRILPKRPSCSGLCKYVLHWNIFTVEKYYTAILNHKISSWLRTIRLSWAILEYQRFWLVWLTPQIKGILELTLLSRYREHLTTCRLRFANLSLNNWGSFRIRKIVGGLTPILQMYGLWAAFCMSCAPYSMLFQEKTC